MCLLFAAVGQTPLNSRHNRSIRPHPSSLLKTSYSDAPIRMSCFYSPRNSLSSFAIIASRRCARGNGFGASLRAVVLALVLIALVGAPRPAQAYSVLTHEVVLDLAWADAIDPLLRQRFPQATDEQMREAHAYAYGGSIIQDLGYYPFGNHEFSDLVHYVRSGDFVVNLMRNAQDINEYAFALGALAHYAADTEGHPAINHAVAMDRPKLRKRYGPSVTYEDDPKAHVSVEFGFDVAQVAASRFPSSRYHDLIGFKVAQPLLERTFLQTYGLPLNSILNDEGLAIGTYRWAVGQVIPAFTQAAVLTKNAAPAHEKNDHNRRSFLYKLSRAQYEQEWGTHYERPGFGARVLAFMFKLLPKVGPFKNANFQTPDAATEDMYFKSVNRTMDRYRAELRQVADGSLKLQNRNFDTGADSAPGAYKLTDDTYSQLLRQLAQTNFKNVTPDLRDNILSFYSEGEGRIATRRFRCEWQSTEIALQALKQLQAPASVTAALAGRGCQ
jgi:hypothetical protein